MKHDDLIMKLGYGGNAKIRQTHYEERVAVHIEIDIDRKTLIDNMDLLARELHMEVETMASKSKRKIKHDRIHVPEMERRKKK